LALPLLRVRYPKHQLFASATLDEILGQQPARASFVEINALQSMVFLNEGATFRPLPLPFEAQLAPVFGVNVADFNGDGHEDLFLAQNFFPLFKDESRLDAGRGLLLLGNGTARLRPVPAAESGLLITGEQRGSATADFDSDGRTDLVVTQNAGSTRLFKNAAAQPGLRVRLLGSPANPDGVGAVLRLQSGTTLGPAREIHSGSGYWSQDSAVQDMAIPSPPFEILVRWPGGTNFSSHPVPTNAREILVDANGGLSVLR
jgi:hypothetical protein